MSQRSTAHPAPGKERAWASAPSVRTEAGTRTRCLMPIRNSPGSTLDLNDIQGFILRGYRMPMVRHFLLTVGVPAEARKLLGRLVNGDESDAPQITTAEDWHVGFEPGPGDNPADPPRRKPDYCLNVGITWPGLIALEIKDRVPTLSFKSFGAFIGRRRRTGGTGGRYRTKRAAELDRRLRQGKRSRSGDAARH